jgi:hypothetical protein
MSNFTSLAIMIHYLLFFKPEIEISISLLSNAAGVGRTYLLKHVKLIICITPDDIMKLKASRPRQNHTML